MVTSQHPGQGDTPRCDPIWLVDVVVEVRLRPEWLPPASSDADDVLRQLLACDLRDACEGSLPRNLERQHNIHVEGTLVLESGGIFGLFGDSIKSRMGYSIKSRILLSSPGWLQWLVHVSYWYSMKGMIKKIRNFGEWICWTPWRSQTQNHWIVGVVSGVKWWGIFFEV